MLKRNLPAILIQAAEYFQEDFLHEVFRIVTLRQMSPHHPAHQRLQMLDQPARGCLVPLPHLVKAF